MLVADIDNLKQTNRQFCHEAGNDLIVHTADDVFAKADQAMYMHKEASKAFADD